MFPQHLIVQFWWNVEKRLELDHELDQSAAQKGIADYLALAESKGFADTLYHREPVDIAATISGGLKSGGFLTTENGQ